MTVRPDIQFLPSSGAVSGDVSTLGDVWADSWRAVGAGGEFVSWARREETLYDARIDGIFKATGVRLQNPLRIDMRSLQQRLAEARSLDDVEAARSELSHRGFENRLQELARQWPHLVPIIDPERPPRLQAGAEKKAADEALASSLARSPWTVTPTLPILGPVPLNPAGVAAGLGQGFTDVFNLATMPLLSSPVGLGARAIVWQGAKMAALNAGTEGVQQAFVQGWRRDAGLDYGWDHAKHAVAGAAMFGFAVDAGGRAAYRGMRHLQGRTATLDADGGVIGWRAPAEDGRPAVPRAIPAPEGQPGIDPVIAARDPMAALDEAAARAPDGSVMRRAVDGDNEAMRQVVAETGAHTDPATRGALAELESYRLFGPPPEIEPHDHFLRLAEAIQRASDPEAPAPGSALRRADVAARGPLDAAAEAALQRLRDQGGSLADLARIMRKRPDLVDASVPVSDHKLRQAAGLAKLSDEAFERVAAGGVAPQHAAIVGDRVLDPAQHVEVLDAISRAGLRSVEQVRLLIGETTSRAGADGPHLSRMGSDGLGRDLTGPRIKTLSGALRGLPKDARIAGVVDQDLARLEAALPHAARGDVRVRAGLQKRMLDAVRALAAADSHVAELLDDAAQAVARGVKEQTATAGLVQRLATEIEAGGVEGLVKPRRSRERLEGRGLDDPFGSEAQAQTKALDERVKFAVGDGRRGGGDGNGRGLSQVPRDEVRGGGGRGGRAAGGQRGAGAQGAPGRAVAPSYRDGDPVRTVKLGRDLAGEYVGHLTRESLDGSTDLNLWIYRKDAKLGTIPRDPVAAQEHFDVRRSWAATMQLTEVRPGQFEVQSVTVDPRMRRAGIARGLYDAIERELGIRLRPSGTLLGDGYKFWQSRAPDLLVNHRWSEPDNMWLSPVRLLAQIEGRERMMRSAGDPSTWGSFKKAAWAKTAEEIEHYRRLLDTVPAEARTPEALAQMFRLRDASDLTAKGAVKWADLRADIDRVIARLPKGVRVDVVERLTWRGHDIDGMWDPHTALVRIALGEGADRVLRHEEVHILRDLGLVTAREWDVLTAKAAALDLRRAFDIDARYREHYEPRAKGDKSLLEAMLVEETIAEMRARYVAGERFGKPIDAILQRVSDFVERVRNALHGRGFLAATDVFRRMETGEMAARRQAYEAERGGAPKFSVGESGERPIARPRVDRTRMQPIEIAPDLARSMGLTGKLVVDVPYIVEKRKKDPDRGALRPDALKSPETAAQWITEALSRAQHAQLFKDGRTWNVIHVQEDGNVRFVAVDPAVDADGRHFVKTAFLAKRGKFLGALLGSVFDHGPNALRFGDDPAHLWSTSHLLSEGNAGLRDPKIDTVVAMLRQAAEAMERAKDPPPGRAQLDESERVGTLGTLAEVCKR